MSQLPHGTFQTVALIDTVAHPIAWDFYNYFPIDPVQPAPQTIAVIARHRVNHMTWLSILSAIQQHVPNGGSVLIVAHGTSHGIFIPLFSGGPVLDTSRMVDIASSLTVTPEQAAHRAGVGDVNIIRQFRQELSAVQDKRLERIELRACNVGRQPHVIDGIRSLFNVTYFGCPEVRDSFFGMTPTGVRPTGMSMLQWQETFPHLPMRINWQEWDSRHPHHRYEYTTPEGRVSLFYQEVAGHRVVCDLAADHSQSVYYWVNDKLPRSTWPGGPLPMHAFVGRPPIFPGESRYRGHLRYAVRRR